MRVLAVVCTRNEEDHIRAALHDLTAEGADVILLDHDSTDRTADRAREFAGRGLLGIERLPWTGRFSLREQLEAKRAVVERVDHDWIVHVDADEWLSAPHEGETLAEGLRRADAAGSDCVHFNEFVFLPRAGEDVSGEEYRRALTRYYLYRPVYPFLMRAWKRSAGLDNLQHAGHLLTGGAEPRIFAEDFPLRHYIALSEEGARRKYLRRAFDDTEVARGWHADRLRVTHDNVRFPDDEEMAHLPCWASKTFDTSCPRATHYWEWPARCADTRAR